MDELGDGKDNLVSVGLTWDPVETDPHDVRPDRSLEEGGASGEKGRIEEKVVVEGRT